jgi:hypothetical protein
MSGGNEVPSQAEIDALLASPLNIEPEKPAGAPFLVQPEVEDASYQTSRSNKVVSQQSNVADTAIKNEQRIAAPKVAGPAPKKEQRIAAIAEEIKVLKNVIGYYQSYAGKT